VLEKRGRKFFKKKKWKEKDSSSNDSTNICLIAKNELSYSKVSNFSIFHESNDYDELSYAFQE